MACATVNITTEADGATHVTVVGRANFESAVPLRDYVKTLPANFAPFAIDLRECCGMDSTFMGVLSMLGLKGYRSGSTVILQNTGESNQALLKGLGVIKLFRFEDTGTTTPDAPRQSASGRPDAAVTAETVLEAHRSLMEADESNVARFEKVVEFTEADLKKLKK